MRLLIKQSNSLYETPLHRAVYWTPFYKTPRCLLTNWWWLIKENVCLLDIASDVLPVGQSAHLQVVVLLFIQQIYVYFRSAMECHSLSSTLPRCIDLRIRVYFRSKWHTIRNGISEVIAVSNVAIHTVPIH